MFFEQIGSADKANNFSTPPVSFHSIRRFVGGAKSRDVEISVVSDNCSFIVSDEIPFCSSTIRRLFLFVRLSTPPNKDQPFKLEASFYL